MLPHRPATTYGHPPDARPVPRNVASRSNFEAYNTSYDSSLSSSDALAISMRRLTQLPRDNAQADFLDKAISKFEFAITNSYAPTTNSNYSHAVKRYLRFAAKCGFSESAALPCPPELLLLYIADSIGRTGAGNAKNNISALASWHHTRGYPFAVPPQMRTVKRAIALHYPIEKQQKPFRPPVTPAMLSTLFQAWASGTSQQKCVLAVALAAWTGQMRLGELLPSSLNSLDPARLPRRDSWGISSRCALTSFIRLPWTKTTRFGGAYVYLLHQYGPFDATSAISRHFQSSPLPPSALICQYATGGDAVVLDKVTFLAMCNAVWSQCGFARITGHSFRIGGTTALLRSGVDTEIVKKMGRWSSDAYLRYWRNVEELFETHAARLNWVDFAI